MATTSGSKPICRLFQTASCIAGAISHATPAIRCFPLLTTLPINVVKTVVGEQTALRLLIVTIAAVWVVALYLLLRAVTPERLDALIFTALGSVSAAACSGCRCRRPMRWVR